jgi:hydroxymethylbilane synthase
VIPTARATLRLGTRRSALATTQSRWVADRLAFPTELVNVTTHGDVSTASLASLGGTGVFVTALRRALLDGDVDLAVHSLKDLPTTAEPGVVIAAIPRREDPRDVLVARDGLSLADLPPGARVGTGSPRRAALLRAVRPDLEVVDVRGNVDTRLRFVGDGELDAVVLALAGLARLGRGDEATDVLGPPVMLPAPGQGALAVECRADDAALAGLLMTLDDAPTRLAVTAERRLLRTLEAGCAAPLGAIGLLDEASGELSLQAVVASTDGRRVLRARATTQAPDLGAAEGLDLAAAENLGDLVARELLDAGAADLVSPGSQSSPSSTGTSSTDSGTTDRNAPALDAVRYTPREGDQ